MPRSAATKIYANFTGGLITEANSLSYPENAASDIVNLDLQEDGSVNRRPGLEFDDSDSISVDLAGRLLFETATNVFKWEAVSGDPSLDIAVVQMGDTLSFYYIRENKVSDSVSIAADPITLTDTFRSSDSTMALRKSSSLEVVSGGGRLYVAGKYIDPFVLIFNTPTEKFDKGSITKTDLLLKIRDFRIFKEGETIDNFSLSGEERQTYMSAAHFYNLANQGYPSKFNDDSGLFPDVRFQDDAYCSTSSDPDGGASLQKAPTYNEASVGFFPTTSDVFHAYQAGGGQTLTEQIAYSPWLLQNDYTGNTPAPRGKFIQEAFFVERKVTVKEDEAGSATLTAELIDALSISEIESSGARPDSVAFYAGRVWYGGLEGDQFTNNIYYSQVVGDDINKASKCYQEADPTSEVINELVATDGGVLNLEEIGKIYKMAPIGPSLVVVADNGVWVISGDGEFSSFTATSFSVRKVTDQGAISSKTISFARDAIYYWGETALYRLVIGQGGALEAQDLTATTIRTEYQRINSLSKDSAFSVFDEGANRILWFYPDVQDDPQFSSVINKAFNRVLYFDISLGAFGKYNIGARLDRLPVSAISASSSTTLLVTDEVTADGNLVTVSGSPVFVSNTSFVPDASTIKVLTIIQSGDDVNYRFSGFTDIDEWKDWQVDQPAFLESGFDSLGDIVGVSKKAPLLQTHFSRTEDGFDQTPEGELTLNRRSGCLVSYGWDWAENYSNPFQAYKLLKNYTPQDSSDMFNYNRSVISTRNRIRGRGSSLGLRFESQEGKDMKLLGYGIVYTARRRP